MTAVLLRSKEGSCSFVLHHHRRQLAPWKGVVVLPSADAQGCSAQAPR